MGERIDFWALLRRSRRIEASWRYLPAAGLPARVSIGRLSDDPERRWFVLVYRKGVDSLLCADEVEARADLHNQGLQVMEMCGPGRWVPG